jgi:GAF domain-containing protein
MSTRRPERPNLKRGKQPNAAAGPRSSAADLRKQLRQRTRELAEAQKLLAESHQQQIATAEVLQVINSSPGDLAPVFDTILEKAHRLCGVAHGGLLLYDGEKFSAVAVRGLSETFAALLRKGVVPGPTLPHRRLLEGARFAQVPDWTEIDDPHARGAAGAGFRTTLFIPLRRKERLLGYITAGRQQVRPFTEKEIALLESFAAQAVIAIENARLFDEGQTRTRELRESLQQQTATADVLKIISRSSVDLETVLDTLVETVTRLCRADQAYMVRGRGDIYDVVAERGLSEVAGEYFRTHPTALSRGTMRGRVALERRAVYISDVLKDPEYTYSDGQKLAGYRTILGIPLLREDTLIGMFVVARTRVEPFTDKEIELATSFADQARRHHHGQQRSPRVHRVHDTAAAPGTCSGGNCGMSLRMSAIGPTRTSGDVRFRAAAWGHCRHGSGVDPQRLDL